MGMQIADGVFFMQSQNGEWLELGEPVEFVTEAEPEQNSVAFTIKPRVVTGTFTGTFTLRDSTRARLRRKLLGFKGHPRIRGLMKAAKVAGIKKRGALERR